jgi:hypothetical protein
MSNINNISTQNLLSSFAGAQRTDQARERTATETKQTQQHQDVLQLSIQKAENIADANSSTDRDAQGFYLPDEKQPDQQPDTHTQHQENENPDSSKSSLEVDPELGHSLDLEA